MDCQKAIILYIPILNQKKNMIIFTDVLEDLEYSQQALSVTKLWGTVSNISQY